MNLGGRHSFHSKEDGGEGSCEYRELVQRPRGRKDRNAMWLERQK